MTHGTAPDSRTVVVEARDFPALLHALSARGYHLKGPVLRDGAVVLDDLAAVDEMPVGWVDAPEPGRYRVRRRDDRSLFGHTVGPNSWKEALYPPKIRLFSADRDSGGFRIHPASEDNRPLALVGVRACDLSAVHLLDQVLLDGPHADAAYAARRAKCFIVAVNCSRAAATCFCSAMGAGPTAGDGADLVVTELLQARRHLLVVSVRTERGAEVLADVPHEEASEREVSQAAVQSERVRAEAGMNRVDLRGLRDLLFRSYESPIWDEVGARCLTCGNCTSVCPTCFCSAVSDTTDLAGARAERTRTWDSCFTMAYSYSTGGTVRYTPSARYRHWLMHKFATWTDQFGSPGCVGCGRCLTWCPVGIDITEVLGRIRRGVRGHKEVGDANAVG